jgi:hypothetical protein
MLNWLEPPEHFIECDDGNGDGFVDECICDVIKEFHKYCGSLAKFRVPEDIDGWWKYYEK